MTTPPSYSGVIYFDDAGELVEVAPGLGPVWIVGRRNPRTGGHRCIKSKALPPRRTPQEAQRDLDRYAAAKHWHEIPF